MPDGLVQVASRLNPFGMERSVRLLPAMSIAATLRELGVKPELHTRVFINDRYIPAGQFEAAVPQVGDVVVIRVVPGDDAKNILGIVMMVATAALAMYMGGPGALALGMQPGGFGAKFLQMSIGIIGALVTNALIQPSSPPTPKVSSTPASYTISGQQNLLAPYSRIPRVYANAMRIYPMQAAPPYTEAHGHRQWLRMLFTCGYGPLHLSNFKIGETRFEDFKDIEYEVRCGYDDDEPITLYKGITFPNPQNIVLIDTANKNTTPNGWHQLTTPNDIDGIAVDLTCPEGLQTINNIGNRRYAHVWVRIQYRLTGPANPWTNRPLLEISDCNQSPVYATDEWEVENGTYDVRVQVTKIAWEPNSSTDDTFFATTTWTNLRAHKNSDPILQPNLTKIALKIRATNQLNGVISDFNCIAGSVLDGNHESPPNGSRAGSWLYDWDPAWNAQGIAGSYDTVTDQVHTAGGKAALLVASDGGRASMASPTIPVKGAYTVVNEVTHRDVQGDKLKIGGWYRAPDSGARLAVVFSDKQDFLLADVLSTIDIVVNGHADGWAQALNSTVKAPKGARYARVVVYCESPAGPPISVWWDDLEFHKVTTNPSAKNILVNASFDKLGQHGEEAGPATGNPARIFTDILQGPANKRPVADDRIDWETLAAWEDYCEANGYFFNGVFDQSTSLFDCLKAVCAIGRASLALEGKFSVVRDLPQTIPIQHFTPRNSSNFKGTKSFADLPHALRVRFKNRDKAYQDDEVVVYADGYNEDGADGLLAASIFETLDETVGVTSSDQAVKDGRYHFAVARLRPETYELTVDFENLVCQRGDLVYVAHDVPMWGQGSGRITMILDEGGVRLDERLTYQPGLAYVLRIRRADASSVLVTLQNDHEVETETYFHRFAEPTPANIAVGDLCMFGVSNYETVPCLVTKITPGQDASATLTLVDYSQPAITNAETGTPIPPFDSRINPTDVLPAPVFSLRWDPNWPTGLAPPNDKGAWRPNIRSDEEVQVVTSDNHAWLRITIGLVVDSSTAPMIAGVEAQYRVAAIDKKVDRGAWDGGTTYAMFEVVTDDDQQWVSVADDNLGNQPSLDEDHSYWSLLMGGQWQAMPLQPYRSEVYADAVEPDANYDVRVRFLGVKGNYSLWTELDAPHVVDQIVTDEPGSIALPWPGPNQTVITGQLINPTGPDALGRYTYKALTDGVTGANEPAWKKKIGKVINDGAGATLIPWRCIGLAAGLAEDIYATVYYAAPHGLLIPGTGRWVGGHWVPMQFGPYNLRLTRNTWVTVIELAATVSKKLDVMRVRAIFGGAWVGRVRVRVRIIESGQIVCGYGVTQPPAVDDPDWVDIMQGDHTLDGDWQPTGAKVTRTHQLQFNALDDDDATITNPSLKVADWHF